MPQKLSVNYFRWVKPETAGAQIDSPVVFRKMYLPKTE